MNNLLIFAAAQMQSVEPGNLPQGHTDAQLSIILTTIFGFAGAIALLIIVVSGFRYIVSGGEPDKVAKAKNGIIYALVGLVVIIAARAIVAYVAEGLQ